MHGRRSFQERPSEREEGGKESRQGRDARSQSKEQQAQANGKAKPSKSADDGEDLVSAEPDLDEEMRRLMGFSSFDSTQVSRQIVITIDLWYFAQLSCSFVACVA